jgi:hypothetical protein
MLNLLFDNKKRRRPELASPSQGLSNTEFVHGPKVDLAGVRQLKAKVLGHYPQPIVRSVGTLRRRKIEAGKRNLCDAGGGGGFR